MQLPLAAASPVTHVHYDRYVIRRLRRLKHHDLADACKRHNRPLLDAARAAETEVGHRLTEATESWRRQFERAYGGLIERVGKLEAERFFPDVAKPRAKKAEAPTPPAPPERPSAPPVQ